MHIQRTSVKNSPKELPKSRSRRSAVRFDRALSAVGVLERELISAPLRWQSRERLYVNDLLMA